MEKFKIQIFEKENPNKKIQVITLDTEDSKWVIANILKLGYLSEEIKETELFYNSILQSLEKEVLVNESVSKDFLQSLLNSLSVSNNALCFVFWDYDSGVDLFLVQNLLENWDYIWYDTSDEAIVLYFPSQDKLILVTDQGFLKTN